MEFKLNVDGYDFISNESLFEHELNRMKFSYILNRDKSYFSLVLLDNKEAREYIISEVNKFIPNLYTYDLGILGNSLFDCNKYIKTIPTVLFNFEDYILRVSNEKNISIERARKLIFEGINLVRDSVFLEYKAKSIMFFDDENYYEFMVSAGDFFSYCVNKIDLNKCFRNESGLTLSDYYENKQYKSRVLKK